MNGFVSEQDAVQSLMLNGHRFWRLYPHGGSQPIFQFCGQGGEESKATTTEMGMRELSDRIQRLSPGSYTLRTSGASNMQHPSELHFNKVNGTTAVGAVQSGTTTSFMEIVGMMRFFSEMQTNSQTAAIEAARAQAKLEAMIEKNNLEMKMLELKLKTENGGFIQQTIDKVFTLIALNNPNAPQTAMQTNAAISGSENILDADANAIQMRMGVALQILATKVGIEPLVEALESLAKQDVSKLQMLLTMAK